ncbi:UrcA family protein [Sphingomonas morindae]|uniref:UrcA family protein n=1 Tax=Sphingomonas morindae TaxID=1541170 RepID=A0ABY4XDI8_9SPHN|nr:UrcA family protein [Sphingomonas morindae]USI75046.1 UrcA family protein [Sphingomonas morindae]
MRTTLLKLSLAGLALIGGGAVAGVAAAAAGPDAGLQRIVLLSDLNLRTASGRAAAGRRIATAADQVCDDQGSRDLARATCRARARAEALRSLDARVAALTAAPVLADAR